MQNSEPTESNNERYFDIAFCILHFELRVFRVSSGWFSHPYKGQNILIAESAGAARRSAKVFLSVRPFDFDAVVPGSVARSLFVIGCFPRRTFAFP